MSTISSLVERLNPEGRAALEKAAHRCKAQRQFYVELEHLLIEMIADSNGETASLLRSFGVDHELVTPELLKAISGFEAGENRSPAISNHLIECLKDAWTGASLSAGNKRIRPGFILWAMLNGDSSRRLILSSAPILARVPVPKLLEEVNNTGGPSSSGSKPSKVSKEMGELIPDGDGEDDPLERFTIDLTDEAMNGRMDPVIGRDDEIRQLIDILLRRRQNNPILTGDAGVGKTAVVEGLAQRIVKAQVPKVLADNKILSLDLGLLQAGASMRGEFEHRLRSIVDAVTASTTPIILFIDEAHTLIGAGGQAGQNDAANLLKPALARGSLRMIAATTWSEYKRYFEKDAALVRRFQVVKITEPEYEKAVTMLRGAADKLERHHSVRIHEGALHDAVRLSQRYIAGRQLPDKAISVLDTACARVAVTQSEIPPPLADAKARIELLETESARIGREIAGDGSNHEERLEEIRREIESLKADATRMESRWTQEKETVDRLLALQKDPTQPPSDVSEFQYLKLKLETLQETGEPLVHAFVNTKAVSEVVSNWTGIPTGQMLRDGAIGARDLLQHLESRIISQKSALEVIARRIQSFFAQLGEPNKPTGVFMLAGPSGVGKTETATALADILYGGPQSLITVNMSEYQEAHTISGLKGAPPGYVGYGTGGVMTEAIRRRPYSVLLLDEIEKAHPDVIELFYQVFDKGQIEDSEGQMIDFRHTLIILTSNVGDEAIAAYADQGNLDPDEMVSAIRPDLRRVFPAAFLGRLTVAPYLPLAAEDLAEIAQMKIGHVRDRLKVVHDCDLTYDEAVLNTIVDLSTESESGARNVDAIISDTLTAQISGVVLDKMIENAVLRSIHIDVDEMGRFNLSVT